jgi:hypothetical protein
VGNPVENRHIDKGKTMTESTESGPQYVRFGPGKTELMPLEWAEAMLASWKEKRPAEFGKHLQMAIGIGK